MRNNAKKLIYSLLITAAAAFVTFTFATLPAAAQSEYYYVPVGDITGAPETATAGEPLELTGTVAPADATNRTIIWSVRDAGATGAVINGNILDTTAAGTVVVTATIENDAVSAAATGVSHTLVVRTDGTLWAWGDNSAGQLGVGSDVEYSNLPVQVGFDNNWAAVAAGGYHTVAVKKDGALWAWGWNEYGQLGRGNDHDGCLYDNFNEEYCPDPVQVGSNENWASVTAGYAHTVALTMDGALWAWGENSYGQLGVGLDLDGCDAVNDYNMLYCPPMQIGSDNEWKTVAAGDSHTVALKNDGTLWAWGRNEYGQLGIDANLAQDDCRDDLYGNNGNMSCYVPLQVGSDAGWEDITAGYGHTLAVKTNGALWAWGWNEFGQLGVGMDAGGCEIIADWGDDYLYCPPIPFPVQVGADNEWKSVAAGDSHTMALKKDGTLWAWGANWYGQLGIETSDPVNCINNDYGDENCYVPVQVNQDDNWAFVAVNGVSFHTSAVKKDGSLWTWGANWDGQLGDGGDDDSFTPIWITIPVDPAASFTRDFTIEVTNAFIYGDVNGDNSVNVGDSMALARWLADWVGVEINEKAADVNVDGKVLIDDLLILRRHIAEWTGYKTLPLLPPQQATPALISPAAFGVRFAAPTINVSSASGKVGDVVDVTISLSNNPGIAAMRLGVRFDVSALRLVEVIDKGKLGERYHRNVYGASPYTLLWANGVSQTNFDYSGEVATLRFEILTETSGSPVTVSYDGDKRDILDVELRPVNFEVNNGTVSAPPQKKITLVGAVPTASVKKLNGNKNDLTVTVAETYSDGATNKITETFSINNNAAASYRVGSHIVYVDTKGNDQIRQCYIVK